jgi:hypothetical protein
MSGSQVGLLYVELLGDALWANPQATVQRTPPMQGEAAGQQQQPEPHQPPVRDNPVSRQEAAEHTAALAQQVVEASAERLVGATLKGAVPEPVDTTGGIRSPPS